MSQSNQDHIADDAWSEQLSQRIKPALAELRKALAPDPTESEQQVETNTADEPQPKVSREWFEARLNEMTYTAVRKRDILARQAAQRALERKALEAGARVLVAPAAPPTTREQELDTIIRRLADQRASRVRDRKAILQSWLDRGLGNRLLEIHVIEEWRLDHPPPPSAPSHEIIPEQPWPKAKRKHWWSRRD